MCVNNYFSINVFDKCIEKNNTTQTGAQSHSGNFDNIILTRAAETVPAYDVANQSLLGSQTV